MVTPWWNVNKGLIINKSILILEISKKTIYLFVDLLLLFFKIKIN